MTMISRLQMRKSKLPESQIEPNEQTYGPLFEVLNSSSSLTLRNHLTSLSLFLRLENVDNYSVYLRAFWEELI